MTIRVCKYSLRTEIGPEEISININAANGLIQKTTSEEITPSDHIGDATEMVGLLKSGSQYANPSPRRDR